MQLPLLKPQDSPQGSNSWDVVYDWQWLPQLPDASPNQKEILYNELTLFYEDPEEVLDAVRLPSLLHQDNQLVTSHIFLCSSGYGLIIKSQSNVKGFFVV
jgi:hypothetical protein